MTSADWRQRAECWRTARLLQRHLDGELGLLSRSEVSAHLRRCRRCGMDADVYRALRAALLASQTDQAAELQALERLNRFAARLGNVDDAAGHDPGSSRTGS
jgi:anti-sigma factor RsiW